MIVGEFLEEAYLGIPYASWETWDPKKYLNTYFKKIGPDSIKTFEFIIEELNYIKAKTQLSGIKVLDFGSGPTIFSAVLVADFASEIYIADYLFSNLSEIKNWINKKRGSFNWKNLVKLALQIEKKETNKKEVDVREEMIRKKSRLFRCDASLDLPLGSTEQFPLVISTFCADSATSSKQIWEIFSKNIFNLVEPGGYILISALRNCKFYKNGDDIFPSANINETDFETFLEQLDFKIEEAKIKVCDIPECKIDGFESILLIRARRGNYKKSDFFRKRLKLTVCSS